MQYYGTRLSENLSRREPEGYLLCLNVPVARTGIQDDHFFRLDREIICPDCIDDWLKDYREEIYD